MIKVRGNRRWDREEEKKRGGRNEGKKDENREATQAVVAVSLTRTLMPVGQPGPRPL